MDRMNAGRVERFLWGQLDSQEQADFLFSCDGKQLEGESIFEALFYETSWGINSAASGLDKESEWAELVAPVSEFAGGSVSPLFPESEWDRLLSNAFEKAEKTERDDNSSAAILRFPKVVRYLAAACIIGAAAGGIIWKQLRTVQHAIPGTVVNVQKEAAEENHGHKNVRRSMLVFDTLVIYSTPNRPRTPISADLGEGVVRLGDKTAMLLEKDAVVTVATKNDTAVAVSVSRGSALFTVDKNRYRSFAVATPACEVSVTGTIFRLNVHGDTTIVSVLEGSVRAVKNNRGRGITIYAGTSVFFRPDTIVVDKGDCAAMLLYRSNLLHDFLMENGVWENGRFVRSGQIPDADTFQ
jgi:uncharacterized cupin superfamily protein